MVPTPPTATEPLHGVARLAPGPEPSGPAPDSTAALDLNGQEANGGTPSAGPPASLPSRRCRTDPPSACSHSPHVDLHWYWLSDSGKRAPWYCGRWDCPGCADELASRWAEIITVASPQRHIVITRMGPDPQLARSQLRNVIKAVRRGQAHGDGSRSNKIEFEYFAALETHDCGFVHAHLLQRGRSIPKRRLSSMLPRYGVGSVCWLRSISEAERPGAVARYVARHLVGHEHSDQMKLGRRVRYSRNFWGGCTTAEVAAALWPKPASPEPWRLVGPSPWNPARARAEREDAARSASLHRKEMRELHLMPAVEREKLLADGVRLP